VILQVKNVARAALTVVAVTFCFVGAMAQERPYPTRPIKLIVPFPAGGSSDILGRVFAERIGAEMGQAVIVDNRTGGNTVIGTQVAATSKPDGYTLLQVTPNAVIVGSLQKNLPYDLERDFTPVVGVGAVPLLLAVPGASTIRSIGDLVAAAKLTQGITYASGGIGSLGHLAPAAFAKAAKINATHVPYRGVAPAMQDLLGNRVGFMFVSSLEGMQVANTGGIRVLAVTSEQRLPNLPNVPTMAELGFGDFTPQVWYGFVVPAKTPAPIVDRLYSAIAKAANDSTVQARLGELGLRMKIRSGPEFAKQMRDESIRWRRVVEENQIKME
jgi:tripartite-type tricarboxylate transporter receptor subunit TctC